MPPQRPGPARITAASSPAGTSATYDSPVPAGSPGVSPFGRHVRRWRAIRRMSQLDLASAAGTTARHISFVETGRSRPGRELILRIGDALRVPLPERNILLAAAGFGASFPTRELGSQAMEPVNRVLAAVLRRRGGLPRLPGAGPRRPVCLPRPFGRGTHRAPAGIRGAALVPAAPGVPAGLFRGITSSPACYTGGGIPSRPFRRKEET